MTEAASDHRRFKLLTPDNWLVPDDTRSGIDIFSADGSTSQITDRDWVERYLDEELSEDVHPEIRNLFAVAQGTLCYGCFFYPLFILGCQELFRVMDSATVWRCRELGGPKKSTFVSRLKWLHQDGHISDEEERRWKAIRELRNMASHQERQSLYDPAQALGILRAASTLINALFADQRR